MSRGKYLAGGQAPGGARPTDRRGAVAPTAALMRALGCGWLAVVIGIMDGRPDVVLLGAPLLLATALAGLQLRRPGPPRLTVTGPTVADQGETITLPVTVHCDGAQLICLRVTTSVDGARSRTVVLRGGAGRSSITVNPAARGLATLARPDALALGIDGLVAGGPVKGPDQRCVVLPVPDRMPRATVPPLRSRAIGAHSTHRAGEGTDLLEIRPFQPGDRTRRIDWRTSARRQQFYVRARTVDSAASLVLCLDSRLDVDQSVANWAHPRCPGIPTSSLDLAVRALTSLAWAHVQQGDRVALIDLGSRSGWVPAGSGRRHYLDLRLRLALASPPQRGTGSIVAPARFDAETVVVVASPFLDAAPASITYQAAAQSSRTIAIDVLPDPLTPDRHTPGALDALDVVLAQRRDRLASLERAGVLVTRWDPGAVPTWLRPRSQT